MTIVEIARLTALALGILLGASFLFESKVPVILRVWLRRLAMLGALWVLFGEPAFRGWQQYLVWLGAEDGVSYLVTENPKFIYVYAFGRFAAWRWIAGIVAALLYWLSMRFVVKPTEGFKLNRDEAVLIALGVVLAGWPGFVLYLIATLILYAVILAIRTADTGVTARFPAALPATLGLLTIPFIQHLLVWLSNALELNLLLYNVTNLSL